GIDATLPSSAWRLALALCPPRTPYADRRRTGRSTATRERFRAVVPIDSARRLSEHRRHTREYSVWGRRRRLRGRWDHDDVRYDPQRVQHRPRRFLLANRRA